jgi:tripartite-type tricarboxylate transporter receptor subunit TctC
MHQMQSTLLRVLLAAAILYCGPALSQTYPAKPIRFIVGFPPGGGADTVARLLSKHLTESWGASFIIENRPGADSAIASEIASKAPPDGYTIVMVTNAHTITPFQRKLPYDPVKDFTPVILAATGPNFLLVHPSMPVKSVKDLIALAKAKPDWMSFGSSGTGTSPYLAMELLKSMTGVKMVHVPYKGTGLAVIDLIGGQIQLMFGAISTTVPFVKNGRLKALAVSSRKRIASAPDVPPVGDTLPGFEATTWYGVLAPARVPNDIIQRLYSGMSAVLQLPEARTYMATLGFDATGEGPKEFADIIHADLERWGKVIRNIPPP